MFLQTNLHARLLCALLLHMQKPHRNQHGPPQKGPSSSKKPATLHATLSPWSPSPTGKTLLHRLMHLSNTQTWFGPGPNLQCRATRCLNWTQPATPCHPQQLANTTLYKLANGTQTSCVGGRMASPCVQIGTLRPLRLAPAHEKPLLEHLHATLYATNPSTA